MNTLVAAEVRSGIFEILQSHNGTTDPLVSPSNVARLAHLFGRDLGAGAASCGFQVRALKRILRILSSDCNLTDEKVCLYAECLSAEAEKDSEQSDRRSVRVSSPETIDIKGFVSGSINCVNCEKKPAITYCLNCFDFLCLTCARRIHAKGKRTTHFEFSLKHCEGEDCISSGTVMCASTGRIFCSKCYTESYIKTIPLSDRPLPKRIDYEKEWLELVRNRSHTEEISSDIGNDWYPFFDRFAVLFYYNFSTRESFRRSPVSLFDDEEPVGDEASDVSERINGLNSMSFSFPF